MLADNTCQKSRTEEFVGGRAELDETQRGAALRNGAPRPAGDVGAGANRPAGNGNAVTSWRRATDRAFTLMVCSGCAGGPVPSVLEQLAESIRRCRHGMLVSAPCLLGQLGCSTHPSRMGILVLLQPCTPERVRIGVPQWIGPIRTSADAEALQAWVERGEWSIAAVPPHLRSPLNWPQSISSRN